MKEDIVVVGARRTPIGSFLGSLSDVPAPVLAGTAIEAALGDSGLGATEVDELLIDLLATSGGWVAPHLHMPLQSGSDPVLRRMRRWHTREQYRRRALDIAARLPVLGLGADIITGDIGPNLVKLDTGPFKHGHVLACQHICDLTAGTDLYLTHSLDDLASQHEFKAPKRCRAPF